MHRLCKQRLQAALMVWASLLISACSEAQVDYQRINHANGARLEVVAVSDLTQLKLFLNRTNGTPYQSFAALKNSLQPCQSLDFAMNAGMYHADFSPVGLYLAPKQARTALNTSVGFGNFFMQPNGVLAWNSRQAVVMSTAKYAQSTFAAEYATQSGPMLIVDGKINPKFSADSTSLNIRNGVGIQNGRLYFAISQNKVSFYQFAQALQQLQLEQALYLDGSISSMYLPQQQRHDQQHKMGPMVVLLNDEACMKQ